MADLFLVDVNLPDRNGIELIEALRGWKKPRSVVC